jgi:hypothetical protein
MPIFIQPAGVTEFERYVANLAGLPGVDFNIAVEDDHLSLRTAPGCPYAAAVCRRQNQAVCHDLQQSGIFFPGSQ